MTSAAEVSKIHREHQLLHPCGAKGRVVHVRKLLEWVLVGLVVGPLRD